MEAQQELDEEADKIEFRFAEDLTETLLKYIGNEQR